MGDPLYGIAPFLVVLGIGLLGFFGWRLADLLRRLSRRSRWERLEAEVLELSLREGRGTGANRGSGVGDVTVFESEDVWFVRYRYTAGGGTHEASGRCLELPPPAQGTTITVLVDPRRPQRSTYLDDRGSLLPRLIGRSLGVAVGLALLWRATVALISGG